MQKSPFKSIADFYERLVPKGLVPPQCVDLEESMLGAMMISEEVPSKVFGIIGDRTEEDSPFYRDAHTLIYRTMLTLYRAKEPVDLLTVKSQLVTDGKIDDCGGVSYLLELTTKVVTTVNVESYARIILEKYIAREVIRICEESKLDAFNQGSDVFDLVGKLADQALHLSMIRSRKSGPTSVADMVGPIYKSITDASERGGMVGVTTGFKIIDEVTHGWEPTTQSLLAGRPGTGKSALAGNFARKAAEADHGVLIFALEMRQVAVYLRMLSSVTRIEHDRLRRGALHEYEWVEVKNGLKRLAKLPIFMDDTPGLSPTDIRARLRQIQSRNKIDIVVVDYLQLMHGSQKTDSREREIASISMDLRNLWRDAHVAGITLSQLNRKIDGTARRPVLSDLRESGSLEQDADDIFFLHTDEKDLGLEIMKINLVRAKARNGPVKDIDLWFDKKYQLFSEFEPFKDTEPISTSF